MKLYYIYPIIFYLIGSIPFSYIIVRFFTKKDVRKLGSGNVGATNAFRAGGVFIGILSLLLDTAKSAIPLFILREYQGTFPIFINPIDFILLLSLFILIGHIYSIFLRFKGGKGVAVAVGILLALFPQVLLNAFIAFLVVFLIFRIVSIASAIGAIAVIISALLLKITPFSKFFLIFISLFIIIKHRTNIMRFVRKKEKKIF